MIFSEKQKEQIQSFFSEFKEKGKNGFLLSQKSFPGIKVYFQDEPAVLLANIMEIEGIQVFVGMDSGEEVLSPLEQYGNDESEIIE